MPSALPFQRTALPIAFPRIAYYPALRTDLIWAPTFGTMASFPHSSALRTTPPCSMSSLPTFYPCAMHLYTQSPAFAMTSLAHFHALRKTLLSALPCPTHFPPLQTALHCSLLSLCNTLNWECWLCVMENFAHSACPRTAGAAQRRVLYTSLTTQKTCPANWPALLRALPRPAPGLTCAHHFPEHFPPNNDLPWTLLCPPQCPAMRNTLPCELPSLGQYNLALSS